MMRRLPIYLLLALLPILFAVGYQVGFRQPVPLPTSIPMNTDGRQLDRLLRSIAAQDWHGSSDDSTPVRVLAQEALVRKLILTCGDVSTYALAVLQQAGYKARIADSLTLEAWNQTNDGHTFLEVWHPTYRQWVILDLDANRLYVETLLQFQRQRTPPILLSADPYFAPGVTGALPDPDWEGETGYPRLLQVVGFATSTGVIFNCAPDENTRVLSYDRQYACLSDLAFRQQFYASTQP